MANSGDGALSDTSSATSSSLSRNGSAEKLGKRFKTGFLSVRETKKGVFNKRKWNKRHVELVGVRMNVCTAEGEQQLIETIDLSKSSVEVSKTHDAAMSITTPKRSYFLRGTSSREIREWADAIKTARERHKLSNNRFLREFVMHKPDGAALGISIGGGVDCSIADKTHIYVVNIAPDGVAAQQGFLKRGDILVEVNGHSLNGVTHGEATQILQQVVGDFHVKVARRGSSKRLLAKSSEASLDPLPATLEADEDAVRSQTRADSQINGHAHGKDDKDEEHKTQGVDGDHTSAPARTDLKGSSTASSRDSQSNVDEASSAVDHPSRPDQRELSEREKKRELLRQKRAQLKEKQEQEILDALQIIDALPEE